MYIYMYDLPYIAQYFKAKPEPDQFNDPTRQKKEGY